MKKIVFTALITWLLVTTNALTEKIDCTQFDKVSSKYLECSAKNLKEKSSKLKQKITAGTVNLKEKIVTNTNDRKKKFDKSSLKEKLVKFKNSKSLTEFLEK